MSSSQRAQAGVAEHRDGPGARRTSRRGSALENIGTDARVKDAGGPLVEAATPKEGVVGWMDAEMLLKESESKDAFPKFINTMEDASVDRQELPGLRAAALQ